MEKSKCLQRIKDTGIVAVVRAENTEQALKIAEAVRRGGIDIIEITMTVPGALGVINELTAAFSDEQLIIGADGADSETLGGLACGAEFIVSPYLNPVLSVSATVTRRFTPGAQITEIVTVMEAAPT